jgi:CDP-glycerol glycerophosphotransferase (TagB/SpsB family)
MPTWRNWLEEVSDETFRQSDYYLNYMELLNSPRLSSFLEEYDLQLNFYIHPKFREYLANFNISAQRVRLIPFGSEPLNQLIMECSMLVTDYSSVCWDVYYQGKPVIFYQFDVDKYNETQGAYIDLETELFGDRAVDNEELFALLEEEAGMDFQLKEKYAEMRRSMYKYLDKNNSKRVIEEIRKRNW